MSLRIVERPSPNHDARPEGLRVDMLVLHYTGMRTAEEAVSRLCDPVARVSSHYTVDEDGTVYAHVPEARRAWHAGISFYAGTPNVNFRSIGIEIVNPGHEFGYRLFPAAQIAAVIALSNGVLARHPIPKHLVVGHSDVAPARKTDPGELFPWERLAQAGIGLWPRTRVRASGDPAMLLRRIGYGLPGDAEVTLEQVLIAFQRRYRPARFDGILDAETEDRLRAVAAECP